MGAIKITGLLIISLAISASQTQAQKPTGCTPATSKDESFWGHIATEIDSDPIAELTGGVRDRTKEPIYGALVEVFVDKGARTPTSPSTERLVGCITGPKGYYRFRGLKTGSYIVAVGANGFNITFVRFKFDPGNRKARKKLDIDLEVGT